MRIVDEALLRTFSGPGRCGWCGRVCRMRHAHHLMSRGMGGCTRLDIAINLISLGSPFDCDCHGEFHRGGILRASLVAVVAAREKRQQGEMLAELYRLVREPTPRRLRKKRKPRRVPHHLKPLRRAT